jgi:Tol biopolymer transport system component
MKHLSLIIMPLLAMLLSWVTIFSSGNRMITVLPTPNPPTTPSFVGGKPRIAYVNNWQIYVMDGDGTNASCLTCSLSLTESTAPAWSPNGKYIAFKMLGVGNIWAVGIVDSNGGNLRKIADYDSGNPDISEDPPSWSLDGTKIAYATYRSGQWGIFVSNVDGSNEQRLSYNDDWVTWPKWSSNGQNIAFTSFNGLVLIKPNVPGAISQVYAQGKHVSSLAWSPDNTRIVFAADDGLFIIGVDGANMHRLADWGQSVVWSPDGGQIAFVSTPEQGCACKSLETIAPDSFNPLTIYRGAWIVDAPAWSPDSKQIIFMANSDPINDSWYNSDIYIVNSDGSQLRYIVKGWSPTWSS